ncbi:sodium-independent sulfate anion transporter isoform X3 [Bombyx mori]|uniref:sodium-independent sulfate anion transporter isoform X3 n=1 Tax=Bombyx mori TaxID=7091 RepID=UPI002ED20C81
MDLNDPRRPLLGEPSRGRLRKTAAKFCGLGSWKIRLPITIWLPRYTLESLFRDLIAGITVGLTSIPQGIAYAMIAGLPPQIGLYSSIFPGIVYSLFGSCKDITLGPTAILSALVAKYVAYSDDFAYLASFLSGCIVLLFGILQLGFILDFISKPVIAGFTTAAALQIGASQLRSLFGVSGSSGNTFVKAIINFFRNITTIQLNDSLLGVVTIISLMLLKHATIPVGPDSSSCRVRFAKLWVYVLRARNALVVFVGSILAYILYVQGWTPFALTGKINGGLPHFGPPPFSTVVGNRTLNFTDMLAVFGAEGLVMPLVTILESVAIAKAFVSLTSWVQARGRHAGDDSAGGLQHSVVLRSEHADHGLLHAHRYQPCLRRHHPRGIPVQSVSRPPRGDSVNGRVLLHPENGPSRDHHRGHDLHHGIRSRDEIVEEQQAGAGGVLADGAGGGGRGAGVRHPVRGGAGRGQDAGARRPPRPAPSTLQGRQPGLHNSDVAGHADVRVLRARAASAAPARGRARARGGAGRAARAAPRLRSGREFDLHDTRPRAEPQVSAVELQGEPQATLRGHTPRLLWAVRERTQH